MRLNILENIPYIIKVHKSIMSVRSSQGDVDSVHDENNSVHSNDTENEDDDDDEEGRVVTDVGLDNFKKMLTISNDSNNPGQMEYNGVMTDAKDAKALMHIVDDLCDHFGQVKGVPKLKFKEPELVNLGYDERYKSKNDLPGDRWYSEIGVFYTDPKVNTQLDLVAIDNVYFDLNLKMTKEGTNAKNYGSTWINIYIPDETMKQFLTAIKEGTKWSVSSHGFNKDEVQHLTSISANMSVDDPPYFNTFHKQLDENNNIIGASIKEVDPISVVMKNQALRSIYKGTAFFSISMNVLTQVGSSATPTPSENVKARIKFNLLDTRILGPAKNINTVSLGGKKTAAGFFKRGKK